MMKKILATAVSSALLASPMIASAYEAGDTYLRFGFTSVAPDDSGNPDDVWAESDTQIGLNIVYMVANNVGLELLAATPFEHDIELKGTGTVGTTKQLPPTISAQYYFSNSSIVTPYLGLGLNYTIFFDENLDELNIDNIELKNSFGLAVQAGMDIAINDNWGINVDIRQIDMETETDSTGSSATDGIEVEIDPMVYSLTAAYKF